MSKVVKIVQKVGVSTLTFYQKDGINHGSMTVSQNGVTELECYYNNGVLNGKYVQYYPSSRVMNLFNYLNGQKNGTFTMWYESGVKQMEGSYLNDEYHGKINTYDEFGDVIKIEQYVNGRLHGQVVSFYPVKMAETSKTRRVMEIAFYDNGLLHGNKISFMPSGKIMSTIPYAHGRPLRY